MVEKSTTKNEAMLERMKSLKSTPKAIQKKIEVKKIQLAPSNKQSLQRAKDETEELKRLKEVKPAGRKKIPDEQKKKHQVSLYLTDSELKYLAGLAEQHYIKPARMLRILVNKSGILEK